MNTDFFSDEGDSFENPYERLAYDIILRAVADYRRLAKQKLYGRAERLRQKEIESIERFFMSEWFQALSAIDGKVVLEQLRKEVQDIDDEGIS